MTEEQLKTLESIKDRLLTVANDLHAKVDNRDLSSDQKSFLLGQMVATTFTLSYKLDSLYNDVSKTKHRINIPCHEQKNHTSEEHGELEQKIDQFFDNQTLMSIVNKAVEESNNIPLKEISLTTEDLARWKNDPREANVKTKELLERVTMESSKDNIFDCEEDNVNIVTRGYSRYMTDLSAKK